MAAIENNYQVKGVFNRMKHAVHYYDQMESKVLQATNMDAWGAPSSLMRSIADGTKETEKLNIIMPAIYRRFIVKETKLWLQVYKALVLLEYLIKYGDEQVLGYAQSNIKVFDSLKTFEYIDEKGYDKGVNVRIRSKAIYDLVMDSEEVKKIRNNAVLSQDRFIGVSSADFVSPSTETTTNKENNENVDAAITDNNDNNSDTNKDNNNTNSPATLNVTSVTKNTTSTAIDDEADNVIFREDFIDPNHLEEDNHAIINGEKVLVKNKKKNKKEKKLDINDDDDNDDDDDDDEKNDEKQEEEKKEKENEEERNDQQNKTQEQDDKKRKSKSRFSFAGLFSSSKSKQSSETESNNETVEEKKEEKELPKLDSTAVTTAAVVATTTTTTMKEDENSEDEDDTWGDFASPTNDDNTFNDGNNLVNLDDTFDISPSQSSTRRTSSEDSVLLDLNLVDSSIMSYSPSINPPTSVKHEYAPSVPLTMKDFDPLNFSYNNIASTNNLHPSNQYYFDNNHIQNKVHQSSYYTSRHQLSHHQLAQPWSPWSNQRSNATVDDLLS